MRRSILLLIALVLAGAPAFAYTIYLKDGSKLVAREKYLVDGDRAIITLPNGTRTSLALAEIDVPRSDQANKSNYGDAMVLEGGSVKELSRDDIPQRQQTLGDLIARGEASARALPETRRAAPARPTTERARPAAPSSVDFRRLPLTPWSQEELTQEIKRFFLAEGLDDVRIWAGTSPDRPLVEVITDSEASVFGALRAAAASLTEVHSTHASEVALLELLMVTSAGERAGQFVLTPQMAADLASDGVEVSAFFVHNVQF